MSSRRVLKVAEAIREVVSMAILIDLRDPRIKDVTVTYVEVAPDLRSAKVHVSVRGDEKKQKLSLEGLRHSAGFLQQKISARLDTRYIPRLKFVIDDGIKHSIEVARILSEVLPDQEASEEADQGPGEIDPDLLAGIDLDTNEPADDLTTGTEPPDEQAAAEPELDSAAPDRDGMEDGR